MMAYAASNWIFNAKLIQLKTCPVSDIEVNTKARPYLILNMTDMFHSYLMPYLQMHVHMRTI